MPTCTARTVRGVQCRRRAANEELTFCTYHHNRQASGGEQKVQEEGPPDVPVVLQRGRCTRMTTRGTTCKNKEMEAGCGYCSVHCTSEEREMRYQRFARVEAKTSPEVGELTKNQCHARVFEGDGLARCSKKSLSSSREEKYCSDHAHAYRLEKSDCPVCMEEIDEAKEIPLSCGHWAHLACLRQWNQPKCPTCRKAMVPSEVSRIIINYNILYSTLQAYSSVLFLLAMQLNQDPMSGEQFPPPMAAFILRFIRNNHLNIGELTEMFANHRLEHAHGAYARLNNSPELGRAIDSVLRD